MSVKQLTTDELESKIKSGKKVLVDFYANWCSPCNFLSPVLDSLADKLENNNEIVKFDIDENVEIAEKYMVSAVPTLVLFHNGVENRRIVGYPEENAVQSIFDY